MAPGSKVASPLTPTVLVGGCLQVNHATPGKTVPRGWESGGRELGVNPRHWSGAWTLAGSLSLPQRGFSEKSALMNSEEQFAIQPIKCSDTLFSARISLAGSLYPVVDENSPSGTAPSSSIPSAAWSHQWAGPAPRRIQAH